MLDAVFAGENQATPSNLKHMRKKTCTGAAIRKNAGEEKSGFVTRFPCVQKFTLLKAFFGVIHSFFEIAHFFLACTFGLFGQTLGLLRWTVDQLACFFLDLACRLFQVANHLVFVHRYLQKVCWK